MKRMDRRDRERDREGEKERKRRKGRRLKGKKEKIIIGGRKL